MDFPSANLPSLKRETQCSIRDFTIAQMILDGEQKKKKNGAPKKEPTINVNIGRILSMAENVARKSNISLGVPGTSDRILKALKNSRNLAHHGLAEFVRKKIYGVIRSAPSGQLSQATADIQLSCNREDKISVEGAMILGALKQQTMTMTELAKMQRVSPAAMTGSIERLEKIGHVKRVGRPRDKRIADVNLTKKGQEFVKVLEKYLTVA